MNIIGGTMKSSKLMFWALSVIAIVLFLGHSPLYAGGKKRTHADYRKKIILFNENADWNDVKSYAAEWEKHGLILSMEIPIINGWLWAFRIISPMRNWRRITAFHQSRPIWSFPQ